MEYAQEKSLAFKVKGGRLAVKMEDGVPAVVLMGRTYLANEEPSVFVNGRKYTVDSIV